jgi:FMN reductase
MKVPFHSHELVSRQEIRIAAILGSVRPGSMTAKALDLCIRGIPTGSNVVVDLIDPKTFCVPFPGQSGGEEAVADLQRRVSLATGVLFATPEYHGSFSSVIKLLIDNLGFPSVLAGKPISLLGVASGQIGAVKALEHLQSVCAHVGALVLPGSVSIARVNGCITQDGTCLDPVIEAQICTAMTVLVAYIRNHICPRVAFEEMVRQTEEAARKSGGGIP